MFQSCVFIIYHFSSILTFQFNVSQESEKDLVNKRLLPAHNIIKADTFDYLIFITNDK